MSEEERPMYMEMVRRTEEAERGCKALRLELEALRQEKATLVNTLETLTGAASAGADELVELRREHHEMLEDLAAEMEAKHVLLDFLSWAEGYIAKEAESSLPGVRVGVQEIFKHNLDAAKAEATAAAPKPSAALERHDAKLRQTNERLTQALTKLRDKAVLIVDRMPRLSENGQADSSMRADLQREIFIIAQSWRSP